MKMTIKLLSRFENDLVIGWDYAIEMLNNGLDYCLNGKYNFLINRIIDIYYESYYLNDNDDYDDGLVYELRSSQVRLLLRILKHLKYSKALELEKL